MSAENKSKKILTTEISEWINREIETSDDPLVRSILGQGKFHVNEYFVQPDSLRLRAAGYRVLKVFFDHQEFIHDREFYTGEILTLCQHLNSPFFISGKKIVLFSHEQIVMCKLAGSVSLWLENFR